MSRSELDLLPKHHGLLSTFDCTRLKNPPTPEILVIVTANIHASKTRLSSKISTGPRAGSRFEVDCGLERAYAFAALLNNIPPRFVADSCSNRRVTSRDGFSRLAHAREPARDGQHVTHCPRCPSCFIQEDFKSCAPTYFAGLPGAPPRLFWKTAGPRD